MAEVLRMPKLRDHIEVFLACHLTASLNTLKILGIIEDYSFVSPVSRQFIEGVDLHIFFNGQAFPVQFTDCLENINAFSRKGIIVVFLPEAVFSNQEKISLTLEKISEKIYKA